MRLESVLVVDDDFIDRTKAETLLRAAGLRVHAVSSGIDALEAAARLRPDLILLDVMMPHMDGLETLARLRADAATRAIPVVFLTSLVTPERVERYRAAGAAGTVAKPLRATDLAKRLRELAGP